jgi:hypothetical protein
MYRWRREVLTTQKGRINVVVSTFEYHAHGSLSAKRVCCSGVPVTFSQDFGELALDVGGFVFLFLFCASIDAQQWNLNTLCDAFIESMQSQFSCIYNPATKTCYSHQRGIWPAGSYSLPFLFVTWLCVGMCMCSGWCITRRK